MQLLNQYMKNSFWFTHYSESCLDIHIKDLLIANTHKYYSKVFAMTKGEIALIAVYWITARARIPLKREAGNYRRPCLTSSRRGIRCVHAFKGTGCDGRMGRGAVLSLLPDIYRRSNLLETK